MFDTFQASAILGKALHPRTSRALGFTLIEALIVVVMISILAALALPSYQSYVKKSRARAAGADLGALALNLENVRQLQLNYPPYAQGTVADVSRFPGWSPAMAQFFSFSVESTVTTYTLKASGQGPSGGCTLTLDHAGAKTASADCGFTSW
jgi:type IV pilus assembly protein PilE